MRLPRASPVASALLSATVAVSLFSTITLAKDSDLPNLSTITNQPDPTTSEPANSNAAQTTKGSDDAAKSSSASNVVITASGSAVGSQSVPAISITGGSETGTDRPRLTGIPKLPGAFSYPPASVPPTQNAPYMQVSNLPEGTVFIAVGAFLGFLAVCVLLWRGLIAWSLHRSVKRAAYQQDLADTKAMFRTPAAPTFKYSDREASNSLSTLGVGKGGKKNRTSTVGHNPAASQSLFFSPTAGVAGGALANPGNRSSNYLPAGYYAAGASAPGNGAGMMHIGSGSRENINLTNLRPNSQGYGRARSMGPSPPDSPAAEFPPTLGHRLIPSTSTLDLNPRTTAPRAPSAYLEDLFDEVGTAPGPHAQGGR